MVDYLPMKATADPEFNVTTLKDRCYYEAFKGAITRTGGKLLPAAKLLGLSLPTARKHAKKLGLWPKMKKGKNGKPKTSK